MENLGVFSDTHTFTLERRLPGPVADAWGRLVGPAALALWQPGGELEPRLGGQVYFPPRHAGHAALVGEVTAWEPDHRLAYAWKHGLPTPDEVSFELTEDGPETRLVLTHALSPVGWGMAGTWHAGLDALRLAMAGASDAEVAAARAETDELRSAYASLFSEVRAKAPGAYMRDLFRATPFHEHLGLELTDVTADRLAVAFTRRPELCLPGGSLHGGALAAAIDVVGAYHAGVAAHRRLAEAGDKGERSLGVRTISLNVDYLRPLIANAFTAATRLVHLGSNLVRVRAECVDDRGDLVATASLNFSY